MILTGKAKLAGVMGWPISHSRSPRLHGYWLQEYGIDGAYLPLSVAPDSVVDALRALPLLGFSGTNVTVPHKEAALATVDEIDANAKRVGAVNTVIVKDNGNQLFPDTHARTGEEEMQRLYTVSFAATELWGHEANPNDTVRLDLWDAYLDEA